MNNNNVGRHISNNCENPKNLIIGLRFSVFCPLRKLSNTLPLESVCMYTYVFVYMYVSTCFSSSLKK